MTNKFFSKTVKKTTLWSVIIAVVLAAAIVVCAICGFHKDASISDCKTLTVSMDSFSYEEGRDEVIDDCESILDDFGLQYHLEGSTSGYTAEIIFVLDKDADLDGLKEAVQAYFDAKVEEEGDLQGADIDVSVATEEVTANLAKHYVLRAAIASVLFAVLAFGYIAIRYKKVTVGIVVGVSILLGMLLTASLVMLTRVIVTETVAAVIAIAGLLTAALTLLSVGKIRAAQKEGTELSNEELVTSSIAVKETLVVVGSLAVAMILVGIFGKTSAAWFAASALLGLIASAFVTLFFAPALYLSLKKVADKRPSKEQYVGAKKTSTKTKKSFSKKAPVEVEETPAQVEEESAAEETTEEPVEEEVETTEAPVEETEETPVEESVEEAEETTEE